MEEPKIEHVTFYRCEGSYNILNSKDKSAQYIFVLPHLSTEQIKEMDLNRSFLIDLERDYNYNPKDISALELAYEIKSIYDSYWIHSGKQKIQKFVEYLESIEEEQEALRHKYEIENAKYQIYIWQNKLHKLESARV